jgi:organic hydroperoxide reductase OsmC/OhrA
MSAASQADGEDRVDAPGATREARVSWLTRPPHGHGHVAVGARAFTALPLSFAGEEAEAEVTTPGELMAAAHSSALTLTLARILERGHNPARELTVTARYRFIGEWYDVEAVEFDVRGRVNDIDGASFERATNEAVERCGHSLGLPSGAAVTVNAELA